MTNAQINYILDSKGLSKKSWTTLEGSIQYMTMNSDKNIYYNPQAVQFFFSDNNYLLIRNTTGDAKLFTGETAPEGYVSIPHDEKVYIVKLSKGGKIDNTSENAGLYHDIISYESISGMFYK